MRQLTPLDAQFLHVESPTTVGHVGSLILLDPSTTPAGEWGLEAVRAVLEPRLHLAPPLRQRLVEVPLGLGRPYWVDDPDFDIEFHLRELARCPRRGDPSSSVSRWRASMPGPWTAGAPSGRGT
jgi:diacylglycerol O-acyltransferase